MSQYWMYDRETQADYADDRPCWYLMVDDLLLRQARTERAAYRYWLRNTEQSLAEEKAQHARLLSAVEEEERE